MKIFVIIGISSFFLGINSGETACANLYQNRTRWGAKKPIQIEYSVFPTKYVIIHHTVTPECHTEVQCSNRMKTIQNFHMETLDFHDIGYNFMVGGDGNVYEGVGWHKVGAHTFGYNTKSIGIAFIGTFTDMLPNANQLQAAKQLLECGVEAGELDENYKLIGARQVSSTLSPGLKLFHEIQKWDNFHET